LLQLLVIRRMLAEGYATSVIGKWLAGREASELERLLEGQAQLTVTPEPENPALAFLKGLGQRMAPPAPPAGPKPAPMAPPPAPTPMRPPAAPAPSEPPAKMAKDAPPFPPEQAKQAPPAAFGPPRSLSAPAKKAAAPGSSSRAEAKQAEASEALESEARDLELASADLAAEAFPDLFPDVLSESFAEAPAPAAPIGEPDALTHWRRLELFPGLELHFRSDFPLPGSPQERDALLTAIAQRLTALAHDRRLPDDHPDRSDRPRPDR
jgi:hypothetical protein